MVVRPHPGNPIMGLSSELPCDINSRVELRKLLTNCEFVVGINTSAMIDAVIFDKPVVAVVLDEYRETQIFTQHFCHMALAGVLTTCDGLKITSLFIKHYKRDGKSGKRKKFIKDFIRPAGRPAGEVGAEHIKNLA